MPSGFGQRVGDYPSQGKHLSINSEYPDSPCGSGSNLVYSVEAVTCPACLALIAENGRKAAERLVQLGYPAAGSGRES